MPRVNRMQELSDAILALARSYQLRDRNRVCRHGITVSQCYALEFIAANDGATVTALAEGLGLDKSTASRVIEGLRAAGLADFAKDSMHRRAKPLSVTARGAALNRKIHDEILAEHTAALSRFTADERAACGRLLEALTRNAAPSPGRRASRARRG